MSKLKLLITGSGGFIMSNLIRKLIYEKYNYEIISIDKITKSSVLHNVYTNKNHTFYIGDIADEHFVNVIFESERPNIVIHGAAETSVCHSLNSPNLFVHSNILGTQVLVNASIKWGVKKFLYCSTDKVMGQLTSDKDAPWTEESPINPRNYYSASKAAGELIVKAASASFGLDYNIARSSNNYGPRQTSDKLIPRVIKCILEDKKIPVYGQGLQIRDWLHTFDNCNGLITIMEKGLPGEIYNISANQEYSNIEVVNEICNVMGKGHNLIEFIKDPRGAAHDFRYAIDSTKLKSLGWTPNMKFKKHLDEQCVRWFLNNRFFL